MSLILVSGDIGSGKDTFLLLFNKFAPKTYENKKFAYKLKQIVALLTGCTVEDLENEDFKNSYLPDIWNSEDKKWTYREVLQYFGTDLLRDRFNQNVHINAFYADFKPLPKLIFYDGNYTGYCSKCGEQINLCDKRQRYCQKCVEEHNSQEHYPDWLVTDCRFPNEFESGAKYNAITIKVIRYMTPVNWLKSKYFNQIQFVPDIKTRILEMQPAKDSERVSKISKMDFVEYLKEHNLVIDPENDKEWKKLTHFSETALNDYYKAGKFDYVIHNDGSLEDFEEKVKTLVAALH